MVEYGYDRDILSIVGPMAMEMALRSITGWGVVPRMASSTYQGVQCKGREREMTRD